VFTRLRFGAMTGNLQSHFAAGSSDNPDADLQGADGKDYSCVPSIFVYRRYFDGSTFRATNLFTSHQEYMKFLTISPILGFPHYP
jgi:hypothetical protein